MKTLLRCWSFWTFVAMPQTAVVLAGPPVAGPTPKDAHHEQMGTPAAAPQALSRRARSAQAVVSFGPYVSVQVNVDAAGNNIVGDAANEPTIAVDPVHRNRMAIAWRQFDTIASNFRQAGYGYSTDRGRTWSAGAVLEPGVFRSDPVLAADAFGNFHFSSLGHAASPDVFEVHVFRTVNGGLSWLPPVYAYGGDKQWLIADPRRSGTGAGQLYQLWTMGFSCCGPVNFVRATAGGGMFEEPLAMPLLQHGTMSTGPTGILYVAGLQTLTAEYGATSSTNARDSSVIPTFTAMQTVDLGGGWWPSSQPNPGGLLGQVWIAAHPWKVGQVYMLASVWSGGSDPLDVYFVRNPDFIRNIWWSAPRRVNDDTGDNWQWFGTMSVAPNGRIDVVWNDTRDSSAANLCALYYSYSTDEGSTWSPNVQVSPVFDSHLGWPQQNKIGDYYHMCPITPGPASRTPLPSTASRTSTTCAYLRTAISMVL